MARNSGLTSNGDSNSKMIVAKSGNATLDPPEGYPDTIIFVG